MRTSHDVDVHVQTKFLGQNMVWIIEAKQWKRPVTKLHVLALRAIVDDVGADRGFIVSEAGFQKGAIEAANQSNVKLKTFDELMQETKGFVEVEVLKTYEKRLTIIEDRYWSHSKEIRIQYGLRFFHFSDFSNFTGQQVILAARIALEYAKMRRYPIDMDRHLEVNKGESIVYNFQQLTNWLNLNLNHFEEKLRDAEWAMFKNGHYNPDPRPTPDGKYTMSEKFAKVMTMEGDDDEVVRQVCSHDLE